MNNISYIRKEILKKNSDRPYFVDNTIYSVNNDYDVFPYPISFTCMLYFS